MQEALIEGEKTEPDKWKVCSIESVKEGGPYRELPIERLKALFHQ